jgi:hypothetical protein
MKPFWASEDQTLRNADTEYHDSIDYTKERARLDALIGSAHDSWPGESKDILTLSRVFLLFFNPDTKNEGIYTLEKQVRDEVGKVHFITKVVLFEEQEDAERFAAHLKIDGVSTPQVKSLDPREVHALAQQLGRSTSLVPAGTRLAPPQHNAVSEALRQDASETDSVLPAAERAFLQRARPELEALYASQFSSAHDSWPGESTDTLTLSRAFVLLFNPQTKDEGIYTFEARVRDEHGREHNINKVVLFEEQEDAERYAALLEADGVPKPQVRSVDPRHLHRNAPLAGPTTSFVPAGTHFLPPRQVSLPGDQNVHFQKSDGVDYTMVRARLEALFRADQSE